MPSSALIVALNAHVREAFDEAWLAIFETRAQRPFVGRGPHDVLRGFNAHYQRLIALPRRTRRSMERMWKRTLSAIALLLTLGQAPAWAANIEVTAGVPPSIRADGKCSLIEAIVNANRDRRTHLDCVAGAGTDTILLPAKSTQRLTAKQALPQITSRIVIEGRQSTIERNATERSYLNFFRVGATGDLTLNKITVSGATASDVLGGAGVFNDGGVVTLNDSSVVNTQTGLVNRGGRAVLQRSTISGSGTSLVGFYGGGGIVNGNAGTLVLTNSAVTGNVAAFGGGGIYNDVDSLLTVVDSIVSNNVISHEGAGGGIKNHGTLVLVGSTVSGNSADVGGGISNSGTATLRDSTVSGNRISGEYGGGGISTVGTLTLDNCTVANNEAPRGGGMYVHYEGTLIIANSTVTGNRASHEGGGLFVYSGTAILHRSIVSGNRTSGDPSGREMTIFYGAVTADDYNLFGHDGDAGVAGFTPGATDIVPTDPVGGILLPLADNGGGTQTHALAIGSPALDASPDDATCPATDQRGNPRPRGPACDMGAFEGVAVLCNGVVTTMVGTINDDRLTGTASSDVISGLIGDDTIFGLDGNDVVCAGSGADVVSGGSGRDLLFGEPGDDRLFGQGGNDTLNGGAGRDQCDGGPGAGDTATACETVSNVP